MRVAVNSHALPIYKKNRIASLLCIFETTIADLHRLLLDVNYTRTITEGSNVLPLSARLIIFSGI